MFCNLRSRSATAYKQHKQNRYKAHLPCHRIMARYSRVGVISCWIDERKLSLFKTLALSFEPLLKLAPVKRRNKLKLPGFSMTITWGVISLGIFASLAALAIASLM